MIGEDEQLTARALAAAMTAALPATCAITVKGEGVHQSVITVCDDRRVEIDCFWYDQVGPDTLKLGMSAANAHLGAVDTGMTQEPRQGAEYLVDLCEGDSRIADGRTHSHGNVIGCVRAWLIERRAVTELYGEWPFIDATRRGLRHLAGLVEAALTAGGPVRVVIERDIGSELWAYGDDRSCRIDEGGGVAFLIGLSQAAHATLGNDRLGAAVAAWTEVGVSLSELTGRVPGLAVLPHAEILEAGDAARWHWQNLLEGARNGGPPLGPYLPLLELVVERPAISRFFSFTSLHWLCFSRSSNFPFVTDGLPVLSPAQDGYTIELGQERWTGAAAATAARLEEILSATPGTPFRGNQADVDVPQIDAELAHQGSALRARRMQRQQWYDAWVIAGDRACEVTLGGSCHVVFHEAGVEHGSMTYDEGAAAVAAVRRWFGDCAPVDLKSPMETPFDRKRSLPIQEKALYPDHPDVATSLNNLAGQYDTQGQYAKAETLIKHSLEIFERALGPDHPDVARSLNNLALFYQNQGRYDEAEPLFKRSLAIREKVLGPDHPDVATSLNDLTGLYYARGQYAKGEPILKRSLEIRKKALGPDHPDVVTSLNNLAGLYLIQGQYAEAEPLFKRSLAIKEKALGPDDPVLVTSLNHLEELYCTQGQYAKAEPLFKRSLAILEKALGPDHPRVAHSLNNLASFYQNQGRYDEAETLFKRSLEIAEKALGPNHLYVTAGLNNLAWLYCTQGRYAQAEPLIKRSLEIAEKALGPDHPDVAASLQFLAKLYRATNREQQAEDLEKRAARIRAIKR